MIVPMAGGTKGGEGVAGAWGKLAPQGLSRGAGSTEEMPEILLRWEWGDTWAAASHLSVTSRIFHGLNLVLKLLARKPEMLLLGIQIRVREEYEVDLRAKWRRTSTTSY